MTRREALLAGVVPLLAAVAGCDGQDADRAFVEAPAPAVRPPAGPVRSGLVAFGDFGGRPAQPAVAGAMERWVAAHRVELVLNGHDHTGSPERVAGDDTVLDRAVIRR